MKKILIVTVSMFIFLTSFSEEKEIEKNPEEISEESNSTRVLLSTKKVLVKSKIKVFVPLEIISDVKIDTTVIGNSTLKVPFEIEMNKTPERKNFYGIRYSEESFDIDSDGKTDTWISSPKYVNKKVMDEGYLTIKGENISKEGTYNKRIYMTITMGE